MGGMGKPQEGAVGGTWPLYKYIQGEGHPDKDESGCLFGVFRHIVSADFPLGFLPRANSTLFEIRWFP